MDANFNAGSGPHPLPASLESQLRELGVTPAPPSDLLQEHLDALPVPILRQLGDLVPPRERSKIPRIRQRRHVWAHPPSASSVSQPSSEQLPGSTAEASKPVELTAAEGRIRWPLLWEQLGGDPTLVPATAAQRDAVRWAEHDFMPGTTHHVGRLGRLMGEEEEMGAWRSAAQNRARERRLQEQGEEFDSESDEEQDEGAGTAGTAGAGGGPIAPNGGSAATHSRPKRSHAHVEAEFEKRLLELFLDGLDTIDYDGIDFSPAEDPIGDRDRVDRYFDDEAPSTASGGTGNGHGTGDKAMENGQGEYDY